MIYFILYYLYQFYPFRKLKQNMKYYNEVLIMDSRFYDSKANFKCYYNQGDSHIVFVVPVFGYGRPQMIMDVLKGKDGNMLTVVQNIKTGEVVKENPENWRERDNERFREIYSPILPANDSYRFDIWLSEKIGSEKVKLYRTKQIK